MEGVEDYLAKLKQGDLERFGTVKEDQGKTYITVKIHSQVRRYSPTSHRPPADAGRSCKWRSSTQSSDTSLSGRNSTRKEVSRQLGPQPLR
jgi:hypothetical protein